MRNKLQLPKPINQNNFDNIKTIQAFNNASIYTKGFSFTSQAGTDNKENINLGGKARFLHGICVYFDMNYGAEQDKLSLLINSEQLIDNVIWWNYNPQGQSGNIFKERQFFPLQRKLSGSDSTELTLKSVKAHDYHIVFFLSDLEIK